jgi:beta-fructofuranosidase
VSVLGPDRPGDLDHHRPRFHIRPPRGYLNDPNGPVTIDGTTHLYFQYRFGVDTDDPVVWGHATSTDLVHWVLHRPAMAPEPGGLDQDGCWSGNTVIAPNGNVMAFYSGFRRDQPVQTSLMAESSDGGRSFGPPRRAVPDPAAPTSRSRDPFVWHDGDGWRMVVGAGDVDDRASMKLYRSDDLVRWSDAGELASLPRTVVDGVDTGAMWECPQVADVDGTEVALVGAWSEETGTMRVLAILPEQGADRLDGLGAYPIDEGPNFYAPSVRLGGPEGPVLWGWITEHRDPEWWREAGWAGAISLPRRISLDSRGRVLSRPVPQVDLLRGGGRSVPLRSGDDVLVGAQVEILLTASGPSRARLGTDEEYLDIEFDPLAHRILVDTSRSSRDVRAHGESIEIGDAWDQDGATLRCFLDGSILELFTGTGRVATMRLYPVAAPPWRLAVSGQVDGQVWDLEAACRAAGDRSADGRSAAWTARLSAVSRVRD